ncbi:MAG: O-antigen ligase family protein [Planctomycetes bacterium]|nr:O-antigen ligase family protein [Planctomycetota bacterium]
MSTFRNTCDVIIEGGLIALLIFAPFCFGAVHPIAFSVLQAAVFVLAFVWVLKVGLLEPTTSARPRRRLVEWSIIVFVIYTLLQWVSPIRFLPSTVCGYATRVALCKVLTYAVAFLLVVGNLGERDRLGRLAATVLCMGATVAVLGIVQVAASLHSIYWWQPPAQGSAPFGPFASGEHFAGYMVMTIPLALCLALAPQRGKGGTARGRTGILLYAAAGAMLLALILCGAPEGVAAFLISCLCLLGLLLVSHQRNAKAKLIAGVVGLVCAIMLWWILAPTIVGDAVIGSRKASIWRSTARMWRHSPVWGFGAGTFENAFPPYKGAALGAADVADASSELLQALAEVGVIGFAIAMVFFSAWWVQCLRGWRSAEDIRVRWMMAGGMASAAGMLAFGLLNSCLRVPANAFTFAIVLGIGYSLAESALGREPEEKRQPEET